MNICIVTVHDILNCGSYWQAWALGKKCSEYGANVFFLKRTAASKIKYRTNNFIKAIGTFVVKSPQEGIYKLKGASNFYKCQKTFKEIKKKHFNKIDLVIIGSDTMWNIDDRGFKDNYIRYFGGEFYDKKQITYAVSSANVGTDELRKLPNIDNIVNNFCGVSVRDINTKSVAENIYKGDVELVCDPTILLHKKEYVELMNKDNIYEKKYIFLYLFKRLSNEQINSLKNMAKEKSLIIVDGIGTNSWADIQSVNSPKEFISNIYYADYVITDTFHGTLFSINFNKKFLVVDRNKNKVLEILSQVELKNKLIKEEECEIEKKIDSMIDYNSVNQKLDKLRSTSIDYLVKFIGSKGEKSK